MSESGDTMTHKTRRVWWMTSVAVLAIAAAVALAGSSFGAELVTAEVTGTANDVTVTQGTSATSTINLTATGSISCAITSASPATATVDTSYSISSAGVVSSSTPSAAKNFFSDGVASGGGGNCGVTWTGAPTAYAITATFAAASTTPVGSYNITLSSAAGSTDETNPAVSGGKLGDATATTITVHVVAPAPPSDTTPPTLHLPSDITAEATSAAGAVVTWTASSDDANPAHPTVSCDAASGGTFPIGITTVHCSATDAANNTANGSFKVTVQDTTAPSLHSVPLDMTVEATNATGAAATWSAITASDVVDGSDPVTCDHNSGDGFPFGTTKVTCSATDAHGNKSSASFTVTVQDTTPPTIVGTPSDITTEATGPSGAVVTYTSPTASDSVDGSVGVSCSPSSGSTFALGTTQVTCSATDAHSNSSSTHFDVKVQDTTPPSLTVPSDITKEATGPSGAAVSFSATASDVVDASPTVTCKVGSTVVHSGDTFALGTVTVSCTAKDASNNESAATTFNVTVQDTTPPTLNLPSNITTIASGNSQATVNYTASATDLVDGTVAVTCTPASGSSFAAGTTTVNCSTADSHHNTANGSFTVTVNYNWAGFFQPVNNPTDSAPCNTVKAGSAIPVKFSLGGYQGMNVIASGYPLATTGTCSGATDPITDTQTVTAGGSSLNYDSTTDTYIYVWKTDKTWAGKGIRLTIVLADGTTHYARFTFTK
jgi:HYR domain